ncbi:cytoplasmic tRNA 2-thiolation protein 2B [Ceratobasidium sp. AG-Ba]|nr:cytoplasmic tRNA 2-thiolation protein 2B [Ceratobasidium sp. AG-Ba]
MSCDDPGTAQVERMPRKPKFDRSPLCIRCKTEARGNIVIRHSVYCRPCFVTQLGHKFRKTLEPTINPPETRPPPGPRRVPLRPVLKADGDLLIGYSGGHGSALLLDLVHESYFTPAQLDPARGTRQVSKREKVWPTARVAFVDLSAAYPGTLDRTEDARRLVEQYPHFQFVPLRIEQAFDLEWASSVGFSVHDALDVDLRSEDLPTISVPPGTTPSVSLLAYLSAQPSASARATALRTLTRLLLQHTAHQTSSSHLLLGTSLTSHAINLLDAVANGAGFTIRQITEETWRGVRIVRPLREIADKEIAAGVWWRRVGVMPRTVGVPSESGITRLTKDFITGLDQSYPSTVHTIAKTCDKLAPKGGMTHSRCPLCERPVQSGVREWKAEIAIRSFELEPLSAADAPRDSEPGTDPVPSATNTTFDPNPIPSATNTLTPSLCYACHTQLTSRGRTTGATHPIAGAVTLPVWVGPNLLRDRRPDVSAYLLD